MTGLLLIYVDLFILEFPLTKHIYYFIMKHGECWKSFFPRLCIDTLTETEFSTRPVTTAVCACLLSADAVEHSRKDDVFYVTPRNEELTSRCGIHVKNNGSIEVFEIN